MRYRLLLCLFVGCLASVSSWAQQDLNSTVQVSRTYEGRLMEVVKPTLPVGYADSLNRFDLRFDYKFSERPFRDLYEFSPLQSVAYHSEGKLVYPWFYAHIGLAYPLASVVVRSCCESARELGMPEAQIPLTHAALILATAPKSNSSEMTILSAMADVDAGKGIQIPEHLRSPLFKNYRYPHDYPNHYVSQRYLPLDLGENKKYYIPGENKNEQAAVEYWNKIKGNK